MYQFLAYTKFLLKSTNQHGVHSPFVYELITNCFYDKTNYEDYSRIQSYRSALLSNKNTIDITDFGSGSRVFKSNTRAIHQIAKTSGTSNKRAKLLYRLMRYFKSDQTLELGTSLGIATHAMALGNEKSNLTTIEGCPIISKFTEVQLNAFQIKNVELKTGAFSKVLPTLNQNNWDLVFFDGHHDKKATLDYFDTLIRSTHNDSIFIFDDIHWSKEMTKAWENIKIHPKVTVTIDTFFWGLVFFRTEQVKEHFTIRL